VPKDEPAVKKTGLAEQGALFGTQEKKSLCSLEEGACHLGGLQGYREVLQGES